MTLAQIVAIGTLPNLVSSKTPLADASLLFIGAAGALIISAGSVASMMGNNLGAVLTGSRMLFALAENGALPRFFSAIHPRYRTPSNAVVFSTIVALGLSLSGSFVILAVRARLPGSSSTRAPARRRCACVIRDFMESSRRRRSWHPVDRWCRWRQLAYRC
jgi:amino acid transporter